MLLMVRRANRKLSAWLVLLPALILPLALSCLLGQGDINAIFGFLGDSLTLLLFSMAFLWLYADRLENLPRPGAFLGGVMILVVAGIIGIVSVFSLNFTAIISGLFLYSILATIIISILALAGVACKKRYTPQLYLAWSFIISVVGIGGLLSLFYFFFVMMQSMGIGNLLFGVVIALILGFIGSTVLFLLLLPFLILALWAPAFQPRFYAIFRLPGMEGIAEIPKDMPPIPIPLTNNDVPEVEEAYIPSVDIQEDEEETPEEPKS